MGILDKIQQRADKIILTNPRDPLLAAWFGGGSNYAAGVIVKPETSMGHRAGSGSLRGCWRPRRGCIEGRRGRGLVAIGLQLSGLLVAALRSTLTHGQQDRKFSLFYTGNVILSIWIQLPFFDAFIGVCPKLRAQPTSSL